MKNSKNFTGIIARYLILVLVALPNLWLFYLIFTPLTVYATNLSLGLVFDTVLIKNIIVVNNEIPIEIIDACIAGSAYYLLLVLNLSTSKINLKKRIGMLALAFGSFFVINVLRIFVLTVILLSDFTFFVLTHKIFWYFMSTIFVIMIWFAEVKVFKIKEIPFYSDMKLLYGKSHFKKSRK